MRLTFLGTAAATACPLPFCRCAACTAAREAGGKDCRARSSLLVNQDLLLDLGPDAPASALRLRFHAAEPGKALRLGHYHILPLPSAHDPAGGSLLYAIWDGKTALLYGTDSLFFDAAIWAALRSFGHKLSCAILDHTYGPDTPGQGHMNANQVAEVARLLRAHHLLAEGGVVLATHLSHEGNPSHAALSAWAQPRGYAIAYDGLRLEI